MTKEQLMRRAIALSEESVGKGGGPFGAVIAKDGVIIAEGANRVTLDNDPTAHAEVEAIRTACARLSRYNLDGLEIYCSCEPCPMCLGAIYWARISRVYYACNRKDAAAAGFSDDLIYHELSLPLAQRQLPITELLPEEGQRAFSLWKDKTDKALY